MAIISNFPGKLLEKMMRFSKALIVLLIVLIFFTPAQADGEGGFGPGGIGTTDGTSNLTLWLKGDAGMYADGSCTTSIVNGEALGCWADQSGSGNHFIQATSESKPTYVTDTLNGEAVMRFNGSQYLEKSYSPELNGDNFTIYIVAQPSDGEYTFRTLLASHCGNSSGTGYVFNAADTDRWNFWLWDINQWVKQRDTGSLDYNWHILAGYFDLSNVQRFDVDGQKRDSDNISMYISNSSCPTRIGAGEPQSTTPDYYLSGDIAEVIVYDTILNFAQRTLVNNYLSEKYNLTNLYDLYTGNEASYNHDVTGIGMDTGSHTSTQSAGLILTDQGFLQENGDYLLIGHTDVANNNTTSDLPTTGDWSSGGKRWTRDWYFSKTDQDSTGGAVDITFDISDSGMSGDFGGSAGNYRLLKRIGTSGDYADIGSATSINGDQVLFDNVDTTLLGSYFTLGTVDPVNSPTAVSLKRLHGGHSGINLIFGLLSLMVISGLCLAVYWWRLEHRH